MTSTESPRGEGWGAMPVWGGKKEGGEQGTSIKFKEETYEHR